MSMIEWPDEDKPNIEAKHRRKRPIEGSWILLGNDESWLIPEIQFLGKDIEVKEKRSYLGQLSVKFDAQYKHHKQLRSLFAKILTSQEDEMLVAEWEDAYMLMYLAVKVNYKITADQINDIGLLREEHVKDFMAALAGAVKKKEPSVGPDLPLPLTAMGGLP